MITEDYVSSEIAKLLREKGFEGYSIITIYDENAANAYIKELQEKHLPYSSDDPKLKEFYYTQPTIQTAMKWLREVHKFDIDVSIEYKNSKKVYYYSILKKTVIRDIDCFHSETNFDSYEVACEAAIKYCLENLI